MAKVKKPLDMGNGVLVRNIEELKEHFNIEKVIEYFLNGGLYSWLADRYYDEEAEQVENLSGETDKSLLSGKLCSIFGIETENEVDIEALELRCKRLEKLRSITSDDEILKNVDYVAFSQEDLGDLLDEDAETIYLCGEKFRIPLSVKNKRYIGVNSPEISISTKNDEINLEEFGIVIVNCNYSEQTYEKLVENIDYSSGDLFDIIDIEQDYEDFGSIYSIDKYRKHRQYDFDKIECIIIPDGTSRIGKQTFMALYNLKKVVIPGSVKEIGDRAFWNCENLMEVVISDGVQKIGEKAFYGTKIQNITIPDSVTQINSQAFSNCIELKNVKMSANIEYIELWAFQETAITSMVIPESIEECYSDVFSDCSELKQLSLPKHIKYSWDSCAEYHEPLSKNCKVIFYSSDSDIRFNHSEKDINIVNEVHQLFDCKFDYDNNDKLLMTAPFRDLISGNPHTVENEELKEILLRQYNNAFEYISESPIIYAEMIEPFVSGAILRPEYEQCGCLVSDIVKGTGYFNIWVKPHKFADFARDYLIPIVVISCKEKFDDEFLLSMIKAIPLTTIRSNLEIQPFYFINIPKLLDDVVLDEEYASENYGDSNKVKLVGENEYCKIDCYNYTEDELKFSNTVFNTVKGYKRSKNVIEAINSYKSYQYFKSRNLM